MNRSFLCASMNAFHFFFHHTLNDRIYDENDWLHSDDIFGKVKERDLSIIVKSQPNLFKTIVPLSEVQI